MPDLTSPMNEEIRHPKVHPKAQLAETKCSVCSEARSEETARAEELPDTIVSLVTKEVIIIGLQRFPNELRSIVAANSGVSKATIEHASRVLEPLQNIGTIYHSSRNPQDGSKSGKLSEFLFPVELQSLVDSWKIAIYQFSLSKFEQRVKKHYKSTSQLYFFRGIVKSMPDSTDEVISSFKAIAEWFKDVEELLDVFQGKPEKTSDRNLDE